MSFLPEDRPGKWAQAKTAVFALDRLFLTFWPFATSHIFLPTQQFPHSFRKTRSAGPAAAASRARISEPESTDFLSDYLRHEPMLRLTS
jgi:hypothetical protein